MISFYRTKLNAKPFFPLKKVLEEEFNSVLKLLVYCYGQILKNKKFKTHKGFSLEDHLRNVLVEPYLRKNKDRFGIGTLGFEVDVGVIGLGHRSIGFLDIKVTNAASNFLGRYDENIYYAIECKRLDGYSTKTNAYIEEGISRFVYAKYGRNMPLACMIGFIEGGNIKKIVNAMNNKLKTHTKIITLQNMIKFKVNDNFKYSYWSKHEKIAGLGLINLYHLLFDYRSIIS